MISHLLAINCICSAHSILVAALLIPLRILLKTESAVASPQLRAQVAASSTSDSTALLHILAILAGVKALSDDVAKLEDLVRDLLWTDVGCIQHLERLLLLLCHLGPILHSYIVFGGRQRCCSSSHIFIINSLGILI